MDIYVYFNSALPVPIGAFEDRMAELIRPWARVSGSGTGRDGSNIDLEVVDASISKSRALSHVRNVLLQLKAPPGTTIDIDGKEESM